MNRMKGKVARLGGLLALAVAAAALLALPGFAAAKDRNHDHIPDRWEQRHHLSLNENQAHRDQDRDGLDNRAEWRAGDDPRNHDTDHDGVMDGAENAGTIASFDAATGKLAITLFGGDTLSGLVVESTRIECEGVEHRFGDDRLMSHSGSEPGDDHGGQGEEPGDDHGGQGEEPGDDNGGRGEEPGDDNGGRGEEPGDDNGGHGEEPGDDNGGNAGGGNAGPGSANSGPGSTSSGPGDDGQGGGDEHANCTNAALVPGAVVQEAELRASQGVATFEEVELAHTN
jgi:hypothetical protein